MDSPETLATLGTHDLERRQTKNKTKHNPAHKSTSVVCPNHLDWVAQTLFKFKCQPKLNCHFEAMIMIFQCNQCLSLLCRGAL
jgi:hypothetical protein